MIEKKDHTLSWTYHEEFDKNGYFLIKNLCNPALLYEYPPSKKSDTGELTRYQKNGNVEFVTDEFQVPGSISRHGLLKYKDISCEIKKILEDKIGRKLYSTYYYDRFYFENQELKPHIDKPLCEISVSVHVSSNVEDNWPFKLKTYSKEEKSIILNPGDGIVYKGFEIEHWRDKLTSKYKTFKKGLNRKDSIYYHQIFFHYVLQDGEFIQFINMME